MNIEEKLHSDSVVGKVYISNKYIRKNYEDLYHVSREVDSLKLFSEKGFNVPKIFESNDSTIIMELINDNCNDDDIREKLIRKELAKLHLIKGDLFGFDNDSYCGDIRVTNSYSDDWASFFKFNRYKPIIDSIIKSNTNMLSDLLYAIRLFDIIEFIVGKKVEISLLHGDPNPRNFLISNNKVYFIDISCFCVCVLSNAIQCGLVVWQYGLEHNFHFGIEIHIQGSFDVLAIQTFRMGSIVFCLADLAKLHWRC